MGDALTCSWRDSKTWAMTLEAVDSVAAWSVAVMMGDGIVMGRTNGEPILSLRWQRYFGIRRETWLHSLHSAASRDYSGDLMRITRGGGSTDNGMSCKIYLPCT